MTTIALLDAEGKMGCQCTDDLRKSQYHVRHVEISDGGDAAFAEPGIAPVPMREAMAHAGAVILAIAQHADREGLARGGTLAPERCNRNHSSFDGRSKPRPGRTEPARDGSLVGIPLEEGGLWQYGRLWEVVVGLAFWFF